MNFRAQLPRTAGARWMRFRLALCLLPGVAISAPLAAPMQEALPRAYLAVVGAPTLRFAEATPPPDLSAHPPAGAPPQPLAPPEAPPEQTTEKVATTAPANEPATDKSAPTADAATAPKEKTNTPPPAILPDDTRPKVRAEDFLPFFQFPGANTNQDITVAPTPPAPGRQIPSSATYRQQ